MRVLEAMQTNVRTIDAEDTVFAAAVEMHKHGVGALPVMSGGILLGMLTDRDIVTRVVARGRDPKEVTAENAMTWKADTCFAEWDVSEAVAVMESHGVHRIPVLDRSYRLVGILSLTDVALKAGDARLVERAIEEIGKKAAGAPHRWEEL